MDKDKRFYQFRCPLCLDVYVVGVPPKNITHANGTTHIVARCPMCGEKITYHIPDKKEGKVNATE